MMRHIPIFTFINKMDREAKDPFELMEDIENVLGIETCPVNWPIGSGKSFKGVFERDIKKITTFTAEGAGQREIETKHLDPESEEALSEIGPMALDQLKEEIELLDGAGQELDMEMVLKGQLSPVFFGSALTNFGVETFLRHFLNMTLPPTPRVAAVSYTHLDVYKRQGQSLTTITAMAPMWRG